MVQHDSRVRRYSSQSTGMENTVGRRNTGSQYIGRNVYLSDFEQQEYQGNGQQTDEYYQETAYNQDMAYTQSAFSDQQYLSDYNETTEHRDTYYEPDYSDAVSSEDKILLDYMELFAQGNAADKRNIPRRQMSSGNGRSSERQPNAKYGNSSARQANPGYGNSSTRQVNTEYGNSSTRQVNTGYGNSSARRVNPGYGNSSARQANTEYGNSSTRQANTGYSHRPSLDYKTNSNRQTQVGYADSHTRQTISKYGKNTHGRSMSDYQESSRRRQSSSHPQNRTMPLRNHPQRHRRKRILMQRLAVSIWALCVIFLVGLLFLTRNRPADQNQRTFQTDANTNQDKMPSTPGNTQPETTLIQGIPAADFAKHPEWTEDFLTPNEYSRPGDPLESVTNIFVHYTANPGTTAAQNRSYFERQKDEHTISVSSHFIIDADGEIIQCVPLDEVAYAVVGRNFDSVSIECCHLTKDGSFTQETYDSLINLLAWLTDIYDLNSEDILRHYDCGGKKCPLYYTEHPDEWEELKKDVDNL